MDVQLEVKQSYYQRNKERLLQKQRERYLLTKQNPTARQQYLNYYKEYYAKNIKPLKANLIKQEPEKHLKKNIVLVV